VTVMCPEPITTPTSEKTFIRECLKLEVDTSLSGQRRTDGPEQVVRAPPRAGIDSLYPPKLTSTALHGLLRGKIQLFHIQAGRPMR
jgi:hypothetical protein